MARTKQTAQAVVSIPGIVPAADTTVITDGLARLTDAYRNKPNVVGWVKALLASSQDLENTIQSVIAAYANPTGDLLTRRARLVGEERNGRSDAELLVAYNLRIAVNRSRGRARDILNIANLMWPSTYNQFPVATWQVEAFNIQGGSTFVEMLGLAKAAGSYGVVRYTEWSTSQNLVAGSRYGGSAGANTFGSVSGVVPSPGKVCASEEAT